MGEKSSNQQLTYWKSTRLIDSRARLSIQAQRVFAVAVAKLQIPPEVERGERVDSRLVRFTVDEYAQLLGRRIDSNSLPGELRKVADELRKTDVFIPKHDRGQKAAGWLMANLAASAELEPGGGVFEIEFSGKLLPYIAGLRKHFRIVELEHAMKLTCKYAFRLYEIAKSWERWREEDGTPRPWKAFDLQELRLLLGVQPHEYKPYGNFKMRVLESARTQINTLTDLRISYEEKREGRKVVGIRFCLVSAPPKSSPEQPPKLSLEASVDPGPELAF